MVSSPYLLKINFKKNENLLYFNEKSKKNLSPTSGSELPYEPQKWNVDGIKNTHNCYGYALGKRVKKIKNKQQPGYSSGFKHIENKEYECKYFYDRLKKDVPASYIEKFDNKCLPGFYKIFLALDKTNDYHWYVQNNNKYWSHKPGHSKVTNVDASKKYIKNPKLANRNYGYLNYKTSCFYACVHSDLSRALDNIYNIN
tara:strand:+ start:483 stop:1079 length:597 start_codon:yes stop_codon:yes gene_type:complete